MAEAELEPVGAFPQLAEQKTVASTPFERARVIFGETSGLYPRSVDPTKPPHDSKNWESGSAEALAEARRYVGIVAGRNYRTHRNSPNLDNPLEARAWNDVVRAADQAHQDADLVDARIQNFYIRGTKQRGEGFPKRPDLVLYRKFGPFRTVGDPKHGIPADNETYLEFYGPRK
jgi:hypothetical protein